MTIRVNITHTYNKCRLTIIVNSTDKKCKLHLLSVLSELTIFVNQWQEMSNDKNNDGQSHWQEMYVTFIVSIVRVHNNC